ncbi:hypothetical protein GQ457_08G028330 [Hibiscus cannabinus]
MFAATFDSKMGCLYSVFDVKKQVKPILAVRMRNWKLQGGENRLSGLLEGISIASLGKARRQGGSSITFFQSAPTLPGNKWCAISSSFREGVSVFCSLVYSGGLSRDLDEFFVEIRDSS